MVDSQQRDIELKWQKIWQEKEIFKPKVDNTKEKFFITVAYPYANSAMHIGHGRTFTMADILARYNRALGKNVLYPMAFHISGTPVLAVADAIAKGDKKQIEMTRDAISDYISDKGAQDELIESFCNPYKIADFFSSKIEETFNTIGLGIDWSRQFSTGNDIYKKFIEWQYKKLYELQLENSMRTTELLKAQKESEKRNQELVQGQKDIKRSAIVETILTMVNTVNYDFAKLVNDAGEAYKKLHPEGSSDELGGILKSIQDKLKLYSDNSSLEFSFDEQGKKIIIFKNRDEV